MSGGDGPGHVIDVQFLGLNEIYLDVLCNLLVVTVLLAAACVTGGTARDPQF